MSKNVFIVGFLVGPTQYDNFQQFVVWHLLYCLCLLSAHASCYLRWIKR
jgi:hypothetical protein